MLFRSEDFVAAARYDLRLRPSSSLVGRALPVPGATGVNTEPAREYRHPRRIGNVAPGAGFNPGAMQSLGPRD